MKPRILAFAGSTRTKSFNKMLVTLAAKEAEAAGSDVTLIDLRDYPMPLYDGDLEETKGFPENAVKLYDLFKQHDGLLLACPEYNSSISGVWKNTIDWVSRPRSGEEYLAAFIGKTAAILSASIGALGGLRGLVHVRAILNNINVLVIPSQVTIPNASQVFSENGTINDKKIVDKVSDISRELVETTKRLKAL